MKIQFATTIGKYAPTWSEAAWLLFKRVDGLGLGLEAVWDEPGAEPELEVELPPVDGVAEEVAGTGIAVSRASK